MVWNMFWAFTMLAMGALSIDTSNAWRLRVQMQATADASALAAAMQGDDQALGKSVAQQTAERNMPNAAHGDVLASTDVIYGIWDASSQTFTPDEDNPNAVKARVLRAEENSNKVKTMMLGLVGLSHWDLGATSIAAMRTGNAISCAGATIVTENFMDTGGGNELSDGVCLYGALGVRTGGNDLITEGVRIGAVDDDTVDINYLRPGSAEEEEIVFEGTIEPVILPQLAAMQTELQEEFGNISDNPDLDADPDTGLITYSGDLLPSFIFDEDGHAEVVYVNQGWWTVQPGDLQPHTIYVVNHGMQLAGGIDASNIAIIANGQIGVGGGPSLQFDEVYMFANGQLNFSGDVLWGDQSAVCGDGEYRAYLFSRQSLSLGGFGSSTGAYGVIGAAPRFSPGGAMKNAGGLYIEASQYTALGGNMRIQGCGEALSGDLDLADFPSEGGGSYLVQ